MAHYVVRRFIYMVVLLLLISLASFIIIQLPPGDYLSTVMAAMLQRGGEINHAAVALLRKQYGLDLPLPVRYLKWLSDLVLRGDLGQSFEWNLPVTTLIGQRLPLTLVLSFATTVLVYLAAMPVGIYSATHQYSTGDYVATFFGFVGVALPNFLIALVLLYLATKYLGWGVIGLFSREYIDAPWSFAKFVDLLKHLPVPVLVLAMSGTAGSDPHHARHAARRAAAAVRDHGALQGAGRAHAALQVPGADRPQPDRQRRGRLPAGAVRR